MGEYDEFKKKIGNKFYCPEGHIIAGKVANTPPYIREWFKQKGRKEIIKLIRTKWAQRYGDDDICNGCYAIFDEILSELEVYTARIDRINKEKVK